MGKRTAGEDKPVVIDVRDIRKKFRVYRDKGSTLKEKVLFSSRRAYEDRWVLRGISFQVRQGEAVGLIGHNGCGKSTTLKMLTRIMYPDAGTIRMEGRVSSLIELGAGFHPDMSGRENIYINASIFGLTKREIDRRLNDMIAFSELEEFIDNPVRTYSSGMYMRLAFAVAINVDADILLIDEILAVGDAAFQAKCFNKLREIKANGTTIVIVSHSLGQIEQICERSVWIDEGVIRMEGAPREVHPHYLAYMGQKNHIAAPENEAERTEPAPESPPAETPKDRWGDGSARIDAVELIGESGRDQEVFRTGEPVRIRIRYHTGEARLTAICGIGLFTLEDISVYGTNTLIDHIGELPLKEQGAVVCEIAGLSLVPGEYKLDVALHKPDGFSYDYWRGARRLRVFSDDQEVGIAHLDHTWKAE